MTLLVDNSWNPFSFYLVFFGDFFGKESVWRLINYEPVLLGLAGLEVSKWLIVASSGEDPLSEEGF